MGGNKAKEIESRQRRRGRQLAGWCGVARWRLRTWMLQNAARAVYSIGRAESATEPTNYRQRDAGQALNHVRFGNLGPPLCRQTRDALAWSEIPHELIGNKLLSTMAGGVGRRRIWRVGMPRTYTPCASRVRRYGEERRCQSNVTLFGCRVFRKCRILPTAVIGR